MQHLSSDEVIDIVEGTASDARTTHVETCAACRKQVDELRRVMAMAREDHVPEPSPLFWHHVSDRVRRAVADEPIPASRWVDVFSWRVLVPATSLAMIFAMAVGAFVTYRDGAHRIDQLVRDEPPAEVSVVAQEDASWALLGDLTSTLDMDTIVDEGIVFGPGAAERAVAQLSSEEAAALVRLLRAELARPQS